MAPTDSFWFLADKGGKLNTTPLLGKGGTLKRLQSTIIIVDCNQGFGYGYGFASKYESRSKYRYGYGYGGESRQISSINNKTTRQDRGPLKQFLNPGAASI